MSDCSKSLRTLFAVSMLFIGASFASAQDLIGAGASFPAPIYNSWGIAYKAAMGKSLTFQVAGSVEGQARAAAGTVDFGASDEPLAADKLSRANLLQFPAVIGAVVVAVNVEGIKANELKLTGPLVADIYLGRITRWNDAAIAALNPELNLPDEAIVPLHRNDASGTTFVFTSYLSQISADWKRSVGAGTLVNWKGGAGATTNGGVAAAIKSTRGAIGYVQFAYAAFEGPDGLATCRLQNSAGKFVRPDRGSFRAAAEGVDWQRSANLAPAMNNAEGDNAWPIISATYILVSKAPNRAARSMEAVKFFGWAFTHGDDLAKSLAYISLPQGAKDKIRKVWTAEFKALPVK